MYVFEETEEKSPLLTTRLRAEKEMMCQKHTSRLGRLEQTNFRSSFPISVKVKAAIEVRKRQEITFRRQQVYKGRQKMERDRQKVGP